MKKFLTKFDIKPSVGIEMNPYDAVDRLSYVDSTTQIVRMLRAGVSAKLRNSQLMTYDGDMNAPSMPIYAPDIADSYRQLHELQDRLKENQRAKTEAMMKAQEEAKKKASGVTSNEGATSDLPSGT